MSIIFVLFCSFADPGAKKSKMMSLYNYLMSLCNQQFYCSVCLVLFWCVCVRKKESFIFYFVSFLF